MSEIPIFTLAIATYISTNDHLERADVNINTGKNARSF